jgi:hypothetical protein
MGASSKAPEIPPAPKPPSRAELAAEDYAKKASETRSLRDYAMSRAVENKGKQSLTNPGLGIPE